MKLIPKATRNFIEFEYMQQCKFPYELKQTLMERKTIGLYDMNGGIWFTTLGSLIHETVHHIVTLIFSENYATTALFRDFINLAFDFIDGVIQYKYWREHIYEAFRVYIRIPFSDWLDWILARDIDHIKVV